MHEIGDLKKKLSCSVLAPRAQDFGVEKNTLSTRVRGENGVCCRAGSRFRADIRLTSGQLVARLPSDFWAKI